MKRVALLTPQVPPSINGIGDYTIRLTQSLRDLGLDARLFTSASQQSSLNWVHPVVSSWAKKPVLEALEPFRPEVVILQFVPQLYHPRGLCLPMEGVLSEIRKELNAKILITFHEFQTDWELDAKKIAMGIYYRFQTRRLAAQTDALVTTCRAYSDILRKVSPPPRRVHEIPVGTNILPADTDSEKIARLKTKYGLHGKKVMTVFGRMSNFRHMDSALLALAQIRSEGINAVLFILGNTRLSEPKLFESFLITAHSLKVKDSLVETGILPSEEISACLRASDVFLFPQADGISTRSTTVMAALAHGLPVAAREPRPGNFENYEIPYARLAPRGDERAFVREALELVKAKDDIEERNRNFLYWQKNFSWQAIGRSYKAVLEGL